jgi:spore maturation protein CgeB
MMQIAFFGSSLLSSYWNGAATYYRGIIAALARRGWRITFFEPDAFGRQQHRDIEPPEWADVVVYRPTVEALHEAFLRGASADVVIKASGVGVLDDEILDAVLVQAERGRVTILWDVDAPATLADIEARCDHPLRDAVPKLDAVLTYGGGEPVVNAYHRVNARCCIPVYNGLDPETHFPVAREPRFDADLAFLGNRLPDREARVDAFFFEAARRLPHRKFLLAGSGWEPWQLPPNVTCIGHLSTRDHNAFNCSPLALINISRDSMASTGFSPATRIFEAAGAGACLMTDGWQGIEQFLTPDEDVIVVDSGQDVVEQLKSLTAERAREIGDKARARMLRDHTYDQRAEIVDHQLRNLLAAKHIRAVA